MTIDIKSSAGRAGNFQHTTNQSSEKFPRFQPIAGHPRGGVWLDENNWVVPWQDGSGRSKMVMDELAKSYAEAYAAVATMFIPFTKAGSFIGRVAVKGWELAKSVWYGVVGTPQGLEVMKNTVECIESLVDGTPLPTTDTGRKCYGVLKAKETAEHIFNYGLGTNDPEKNSIP